MNDNVDKDNQHIQKDFTNTNLISIEEAVEKDDSKLMDELLERSFNENTEKEVESYFINYIIEKTPNFLMN